MDLNNKRNKKSLKDKLVFAAKLIFSAGFIIYLVYYLDFENIINAFVDANYIPLLAAFLIGIINLYIKFYKWHYLCFSVLKEKSKIRTWASFISGVTAGIFTPARIGEFFARLLPLKAHNAVSVTSLTIVDKITNLIIVMFFGSLTVIAAFVKGILEVNLPNIAMLIIGFVSILAMVLILMKGNFINFLRRFSKYKLIEKIITGIEPLETLDKKILTTVFAQALILVSINIIQLTILFAAFENEFIFANFFLASNLIFFSKTLLGSLAFGEIGVREATAVYFAGQLGFSEAAGFNAAIALFVINILIPAIIGIYFLNKNYD